MGPRANVRNRSGRCIAHTATRDSSESVHDSRVGPVERFVNSNFFVLGMITAVVAAAAFPSIGVDGSPLNPERVIGNFGVAAVFLLSGLSLKLSELRAAALNVRLNFLTQFFSMGLIPLLSYPVILCLKGTGFFHAKLLDGLMITACLPTTVNMCVVLTQSAGGNVATALANAVLGNALGVIVTPALLMLTLGAAVDVPFLSIMHKLAMKVLLPVAVGQALRATPLLEFQARRKGAFKRASEIVLLLIIWNAFSNAFTSGFGISAAELILLGTALPVLHLGAFACLLATFTSGLLAVPRRDAVAAAFVASHKTLAFGLPLIKTVFEGSPSLAYFCAPIMLLHPLQLIIGSALVPRLQRFLNHPD